MRYHVFIEGSRDGTPDGIAHLANALGHRYGMSPPAVMRRLEEGRFCARASLDLTSAQKLAGELEALGAQTSLVAEGANPDSGGPGPAYASGLAAAFAGDRLRDDVRLDLGALGIPSHEDAWSLSHIDGTEDTRTAPPPLPGAGPPPVPRRDRGKPPPVPGTTGRIALGTESSGPLVSDPFLPPETREAQLRLATRALPVVTSAAAAAEVTTEPVALKRPSVAVRLSDAMAESPRARFTAGVVLAFVLGLLPAEIYAWSRAGSAYDDIRADLAADYRAAADSPERWDNLAVARDGAAALITARQRRLAVSSCLIWLAVACVTGFVWFRVIDWRVGD